MRAPLVCGVAGGVGTTTIAGALHAVDGGVYRGGPAEIIVCRTTASSLALAHRVVNTVVGRPVLVVVADGPLRTSAPVRARLTMVAPHVTAVVVMPYVPQWREIDQALVEAEQVVRVPAGQVPKGLRAWVSALRQIGDAVIPLLEHPLHEEAGHSAAGLASNQSAPHHLGAPPSAGKAGSAQHPGMAAIRGSEPPLPPAAASN